MVWFAMVFRPPYHGILTPPYLTSCWYSIYLYQLFMFFWTPAMEFWISFKKSDGLICHGISTPLPWYFDPPYNLQVVDIAYTNINFSCSFEPLPWNFEPPLKNKMVWFAMVFRPPSHGILTPQFTKCWYSIYQYQLYMLIWAICHRILNPLS